jgi:hypothetical protein
MNSIISNSVVSRDDIPVVCRETLRTIEVLDSTMTDLCSRTDKAIKDLDKQPKSNKMDKSSLKEKSKSKVGAAKNSLESDAVDDINFLKDMIENVSARKVTLATRAYDLLDHAVKCVDEEIRIIEKNMKLNGYDIPAIDPEDTMLGKRSRSGESVMSEPVYCTCRSIAYGDMISCDNEKCNIEWFHFGCVGLTKMPKGDWYCKTCKSLLNR